MTDPTSRNAGILYIIATPIGNREDISARALRVLASVDLILAEDTRHSLPLLTALGLKKPMMALHAHNESIKSEDIVDKLIQGKIIALISDAGTPLISDPGYPLVTLARAHGIDVIPIPGPCALITALSAAGVPCDTFTFYGFLPAKSSARRQKLESLRSVTHTLVFYESTHRILSCIQDMILVYGAETRITLAKELTKTFERFITGQGDEITAWLLSDPNHTKGEFVLIVHPRLVPKEDGDDLRLLSILMKELPLKQAVKLASQLTDKAKNELYETALALQQKNNL